MIAKRPLRPERLRQVPPGFSWVDHRLIRHAHLRGCSPTAWALYLFLVTVADAQGLSYYSDAAISRHLSIDAVTLATAREELVRADLIAYRQPLYQVLALPERSASGREAEGARSGQSQSAAEILRRALEGSHR
jgi:hypothetical protein